MKGPLLAVDTPSLLFRAFYALPDSIVGPDGKPVNALLGTANLILREIEIHRPRAVVLCFGPDAASYRTALYPAYHAEREAAMPDDLSPQFAASRDFFAAFGWTVATSKDLEADDLLGTYAGREAEAGGHALLMTGDRDMFQCAGERVTVLYVKTGGKGKGAEEVTPEEVEKRYGIPPALVPDFIALRGDPSDGLPGAKGVGPKTAAELLRRHGSLEVVLDNSIREPRPRPSQRPARGSRGPARLQGHRHPARRRRRPSSRPRDRLGRCGRGGARARHESAGGTTRGIHFLGLNHRFLGNHQAGAVNAPKEEVDEKSGARPRLGVLDQRRG
jgi:5'-3' exonuclease